MVDRRVPERANCAIAIAPNRLLHQSARSEHSSDQCVSFSESAALDLTRHILKLPELIGLIGGSNRWPKPIWSEKKEEDEKKKKKDCSADLVDY